MSTCIARVTQTGVSATHEAAAPMSHPSWTSPFHSWSSAPAALLPLDAALPPHRCGSPRPRSLFASSHSCVSSRHRSRRTPRFGCAAPARPFTSSC
jgi:hypothetical protein